MNQPSSGRSRLRTALWALVAAAFWAGSIFVAIRAWDFVTEKREAIRRRLGINDKSGVIETGLYFVQFRHVSVPAEGRYGGLAELGDGVLHSSRTGQLTLVAPDFSTRTLPVRVPTNYEDFERDLTPHGLVDADFFAVKDIAVLPLGGTSARLIASYNVWDGKDGCYWLRVASTVISDVARADQANAWSDWTTHYDAKPCTPLAPRERGLLRATLAAGGRLAVLDANRVLLTVGGGFADDSLSLVSRDTPFGKTVIVGLDGTPASLFTTGHRNQQGLFRASDGSIYLTEHGDRGGDEINVLRQGADYGWPIVTYGTSYGKMDLPANPKVGGHDGYEKPLFSWVPSIGASQLIAVEQPRFKAWQGDLLVTSLRDQTVYRIRQDAGAVRYVEPIKIGYRLRDILETSRGELVILTDGGPLIYLTPLDATTLDGTGNPLDQGRVLAAQCSACHSLERDGPNAIGPALFGVVGRDVASHPGFTYSAALQDVGGRWSKSRLRDYLKDPNAFAPGTGMVLTAPLNGSQVDAIVEFLASLR